MHFHLVVPRSIGFSDATLCEFSQPPWVSNQGTKKIVKLKWPKLLCTYHSTNLKYWYKKKYFGFTVVSDEEKTNDNDVEKSKKAPKAHFVKMLPNLELGMTFLLAYEKIRKEMKEIEERGELQQHQVPEDSLPKVNKAKSERHKFVRLPSSVRMFRIL